MATMSQGGMSWERVKEAFRRDWEQTKHDLHMSGGHELNQTVSDTLKQATNKEPIPFDDKPNRPKVIGSWTDAEAPIRFGFDARRRLGERHAEWSYHLDELLRAEWEWGQYGAQADRPWDEVKGWIRYGYEYKPNG